MGHYHDHSHHTPHIENINRAFIWGIGLNLAFVIVEAGAGLYLNSLALLSDAGHNLSDVVSLYTYGYKKSTILVSLLNAIILLVAVGVIFSESIEKLKNPQPIEGNAIAWVAGIGIFINAFTAWLFFKDRKHDLNIKGAYLHMAADTLVSVGVLISGIIIQYTNWYMIDPIIGLVVAIVILISTWNLLHDSLRLSLDGVPVGINPDKIKTLILEDNRVKEIHHLHIWAISTTQTALTAHIVIDSFADSQNLKCHLKEILRKANIQHVTLEMELPGEHCDGNCC